MTDLRSTWPAEIHDPRMGHSRIGTLPASKKWQEVVRLISEGANVAAVADATLNAAERALAWVQKNAGFREAVRLLTQVAVAGGTPDPLAHLAAAGISVPKGASLVDLMLGISDAHDRRVEEARDRSDFGEVARRALSTAVVGYLEKRLGGLFEPTPTEVESALKGLSNPRTFGDVFQSFAANLTNETLDHFLSRTLSTHLGEGHQFQTANQKAQFESALRTHCEEASEIVREFGEDWFSKHRYEEGGSISAESAEGFGWYAMQKMRAELKVRAAKDAK